MAKTKEIVSDARMSGMADALRSLAFRLMETSGDLYKGNLAGVSYVVRSVKFELSELEMDLHYYRCRKREEGK